MQALYEYIFEHVTGCFKRQYYEVSEILIDGVDFFVAFPRRFGRYCLSLEATPTFAAPVPG
jgi:hypothetical protein